MSCGLHKERAPASIFVAIHSQTKLPPEASSKVRRERHKNDDCHKVRMAPSDYEHELRAP
eukprot:4116741-Pyramimonas_sp.AAC.1